MISIPEDPIRKVIKHPSDVVKWAQIQGYMTARSINKWFYQRFSDPGDMDVMSEKWDILILVDACRYDYFAEVNSIPGELERRRSPGSMSKEFINSSFADRELHDTVYVTGNPFVAEVPPDTFHNVIKIDDSILAGDVEAVDPEEVAETTLDVLAEYPQKRVIAHFMQPHLPFLTPFGQSVSEGLKWNNGQFLPGDNSVSEVRRAYRENVEYLLDTVEELVAELNNRVVISSDHGELLGERLSPVPIRGWEHPIGIYHDALLEVPWHRVPGEPREVVPDPPVGQPEVDMERLNERLKTLGYK